MELPAFTGLEKWDLDPSFVHAQILTDFPCVCAVRGRVAHADLAPPQAPRPRRAPWPRPHHRERLLRHRRRPPALRRPCAPRLKPDRFPPRSKHRLTRWLSCAELTSIRYCVQEARSAFAFRTPPFEPPRSRRQRLTFAPFVRRPATSTRSTPCVRELQTTIVVQPTQRVGAFAHADAPSLCACAVPHVREL